MFCRGCRIARRHSADILSASSRALMPIMSAPGAQRNATEEASVTPRQRYECTQRVRRAVACGKVTGPQGGLIAGCHRPRGGIAAALLVSPWRREVAPRRASCAWRTYRTTGRYGNRITCMRCVRKSSNPPAPASYFAELKAGQSGEVVLFVNDTVYPRRGEQGSYYTNNTGIADICIEPIRMSEFAGIVRAAGQLNQQSLSEERCLHVR